MLSQTKIAEHLDLSQQAVADFLSRLSIDYKTSSIDAIRVQYIRHLRSQAAGHRSENGMDLIKERVMTERVDRELKQLAVAEKKGQLINVEQLEPEIMQMVGAFKSELLSRDDKLKFELDSLYGVDVDLNILNEHTNNALSQLARYSPSGEVTHSATSTIADAAAENEYAGMGKDAPPLVEQGVS